MEVTWQRLLDSILEVRKSKSKFLSSIEIMFPKVFWITEILVFCKWNDITCRYFTLAPKLPTVKENYNMNYARYP